MRRRAFSCFISVIYVYEKVNICQAGESPRKRCERRSVSITPANSSATSSSLSGQVIQLCPSCPHLLQRGFLFGVGIFFTTRKCSITSANTSCVIRVILAFCLRRYSFSFRSSHSVSISCSTAVIGETFIDESHNNGSRGTSLHNNSALSLTTLPPV